MHLVVTIEELRALLRAGTGNPVTPCPHCGDELCDGTDEVCDKGA
jgi:hypothetical protein